MCLLLFALDSATSRSILPGKHSKTPDQTVHHIFVPNVVLGPINKSQGEFCGANRVFFNEAKSYELRPTYLVRKNEA